MGHVAKAKGQVTKEEIQLASAMMDRMNLHGEQRRAAQDAFREGKDSDFPLEDVLVRVKISTAGRFDLLQFFLELQISAAFADGSIHPSERNVLHKIARGLGFSSEQLERRLQMQEAAFRFQSQGGFMVSIKANLQVVAGNKLHKRISWPTRTKFWMCLQMQTVKPLSVLIVN